VDSTVPHVRPWYRRWAPVSIGLAALLAGGGAAVAFTQVANRSAERTGPVAAPAPATPPAATTTEPPSLSPTTSPTVSASPTRSATRSSRPRTTPPPGGGPAPDHVPDIALSLTTDQYAGEIIGLRTVRARVDVKNAAKSHRATVVIRWRENGKEIARATRVVTGSGRFTVTFQHEYQNCGQEQSAHVTVDGSHREAVTIAEGIELIGWICNG
jgi:hypothetical protein